ncbi:MAG: lysoplasmalogenase [Sphaerochaetaceae bacterium]|nr:lysoplasmalogenase [Sphaerochaetaceae bacterium]
MTLKHIVALAIYLIDVTLCLVSIRRKDSKVYALTKPLLMPLLCVVYLVFLPVALRSQNHQLFIVLALMFHTLGDVMLLFPRSKTMKYFYAGMAAFFLGHILYALWFVRAEVGHSIWGAIVMLIVCIIMQYLLYRQLMAGPRKYAPKLVPYSSGLALFAVSITSTLGNGSPVYATLICMLGISLFCFSDYCILRRTVRMPLFGQMVVMSTYIAAESLIVLGILLLQIF